MSRPTFVEIDVAAFSHNLKRVRDFAPQQKILALFKANAYGHGIENFVSAFTDVDALGVCCIEEALALRQKTVKAPIVLMEGFFDKNELQCISEQNFQIVIHQAQQLMALEKAVIKSPVTVWLKIDTGMHRLGFPTTEIKAIYKKLSNLTSVKEIILMTHFADADDRNKGTTEQQLTCFNEITQEFVAPRSLANSAAIINFPATHGDWVRPGIMLYGISPFADKTGLDLNLKPVMTLKSSLISIHQCKKGDAIGYGGIYTCPEDMPIGVIAIGYGDGYPRHLKNNTPVLIHNQEVALVGRVSMDMITVDLRKVPNAKVGDVATLWGKGLPVERIAASAETIPYELVCGIKKRIHVK